jgi:hypothetical protein
VLCVALPHLKAKTVQAEVGDTLVDCYTAHGEFEKASSVVAELCGVIQPTCGCDLARRAPLNLVLSGPKGAEIHPAKLSHIRLIALAGLAAVPA